MTSGFAKRCSNWTTADRRRTGAGSFGPYSTRRRAASTPLSPGSGPDIRPSSTSSFDRSPRSSSSRGRRSLHWWVLAAPAVPGCLDHGFRRAHFARLTVRTVRARIGRHRRTMFLFRRVDHAATASSVSSDRDVNARRARRGIWRRGRITLARAGASSHQVSMWGHSRVRARWLGDVESVAGAARLSGSALFRE